MDSDLSFPTRCLALTGGIACGKSTVAQLLERAGLRRWDLDQLARQVVLPGTPGYDQVVERFGTAILQSDGQLDRARLAQRVFTSTQDRESLERILHPLIWERLRQSLQEDTDSGEAPETVVEIPLLFEKGHQSRFAKVWVVASDPELQLQRLRHRDGLDEAQARARLQSQWPIERKAALADWVIWNNGSLEELNSQVDRGLQAWRKERDA